MDRVSLHGVDRSVMLTGFISPSSLDFSLFISVLAHDSVSLLRSDQELMGVGVLVVAEASSSIHLTIFNALIFHHKLVSRGRKVSVIPPQDTSVGGTGEELVTGSRSSQPLDIIHGVVMRLLKDGCK